MLPWFQTDVLLEDLVALFLGHTGAGVGDHHLHTFVTLADGQVDGRIRRRVGDGIGEQVVQHAAHQFGVGIDPGRLGQIGVDQNPPYARRHLRLSRGGAGHLGQIDSFVVGVDTSRLEPFNIQQVENQPQHPPRTFLTAFDHFRPLVVADHAQQIEVAHDGRQRALQIVHEHLGQVFLEL